jgi:hypothetical protein
MGGIRIWIKVTSRIRIRIKVMRIRNTVLKQSYSPFSSPVTGVGSPIVKVTGEPELFSMGFTAVGQAAAAQGTLVRGQNITV